jgi:hypothetical protein
MYSDQHNPPNMGGDPTDRGRVYISNSLIRNRMGEHVGKGLFAKTFLPKDSIICSYWGKVVKTSVAKSDSYNSDYVLQCSPEWSIDSKNKLSCYGRYCNDPIFPDQVNADLVGEDTDGERTGVIGYVQAIKDIQEGEEIYVSYGIGYWCHERYASNLNIFSIQYLLTQPQFARFFNRTYIEKHPFPDFVAFF